MEKAPKKNTKAPSSSDFPKKTSKSSKKTSEKSKSIAPKQKPDKESSPLKIVCRIFLLAIWVILALIAVNGFWAIIFTRIITVEELKSPLASSIFGLVYYISSLLVIIFIPQKFFKRRSYLKTTRKSLGLEGFPTFSDLGLAPVAFFAYLIPAYLLSMLFELIPGFNATEKQDLSISLTSFSSKPEKLIVFISLCVIAPIVEELIFRGWLYEKLRRIIPEKLSIPLSILIVSVVFGLIHGQWNVAVNVFALSAISCLLRETTGTIYASIFLHILKNAIAFILVYVIGVS